MKLTILHRLAEVEKSKKSQSEKNNILVASQEKG